MTATPARRRSEKEARAASGTCPTCRQRWPLLEGLEGRGWMTASAVARRLGDSVASVARRLADAARDGLIERRRVGHRPPEYRVGNYIAEEKP